MTPANQKALDWLHWAVSIKDQNTEEYKYIKDTIAAQPVTDNEVQDASVALQDLMDTGKYSIIEHHDAIVTLIRAATAHKNCDALVKALEWVANKGKTIMGARQIANQALAAHRAQEVK